MRTATRIGSVRRNTTRPEDARLGIKKRQREIDKALNASVKIDGVYVFGPRKMPLVKFINSKEKQIEKLCLYL